MKSGNAFTPKEPAGIRGNEGLDRRAMLHLISALGKAMAVV